MERLTFGPQHSEDGVHDVTGQPWCFPCRCVLQSECARGNQPGQWLWSFDMEQQCLAVLDLNPSNISREESRTVSLQQEQNKRLDVPHILPMVPPQASTCFLKNILQYRMHRCLYLRLCHWSCYLFPLTKWEQAPHIPKQHKSQAHILYHFAVTHAQKCPVSWRRRWCLWIAAG